MVARDGALFVLSVLCRAYSPDMMASQVSKTSDEDEVEIIHPLAVLLVYRGPS